MVRIQWIKYKGKKILYVNLANLLEKEIINWIKIRAELHLDKVSGTVLILCDATNTSSTPKLIAESKEVINRMKIKGIQRKTAIVGLSERQQLILRSLVKHVYCCSSLEEGKEWLITEE